MSKRTTLSYTSVFMLSSLFMVVSMVYFLFTAHSRWQILAGKYGKMQTKRSSVLNQAPDEMDGFKSRSEELVTDKAKTNKNTFKKQLNETTQVDVPRKNLRENNASVEADKLKTNETVQKKVENTTTEKKIVNETTPCGEGKIYFSNTYYDCDGLMKGVQNVKTQTEKEETENGIAIPTRAKQLTPTLNLHHSNSSDKTEPANGITTKNINETGNSPSSNSSRKLLVNCGGSFPWPVELFIDTYPNSSEYEIFTFVHERSYKTMYSMFPKHTFIAAEASYKNATQNVDIKSFGSGSDVTQTKVQIDLANWLETNTQVSDYVILRLESKEEIKVLKRLTESKAIEHIDKFYTSLGKESQEDSDAMHKLLKQYKLNAGIWDNFAQTYSDFDVLNPKHIPTAGQSITMCQKTEDKEKFALCLFSSSGSVNSIKVLKFLQNFSPESRLRITVFLPYQLLKSGLIKLDKLLETFKIGMYLDADEADDEKHQYNVLKRKLTFFRRRLQQNGQVLQYIFAGNNTNHTIIHRLKEKLHYSIIEGGTDITNITDKTLTGRTVSIDDTGRRDGDFLLINIDTTNTEYLVLYMLRRFAPWLLHISDCEVISNGDLLNTTDVVTL